MTQKEALLESIRAVSGCNVDQSEKVYKVYVEHKAIIFKAHAGIVLTHGAFMDKDVIWNAINNW